MASEMELRIGRSNDPESPYILRIFDVGKSPERKVAYGETYRQRAGAVNAAEAIKALRWNFETFKGSDGKWYWHLRSTNGEILVRSNFSYSSQADAGWREAWLKTNAPGARIV